MSQYTRGNATFKNNSATVVGASCDWLTASNVKIGDIIKRTGVNAWYQVSAINLATNLNITPVYAGANASNVNYAVVRDFTSNYDFPEISGGDYDWPDVYTKAVRAIDTKLADISASATGGGGGGTASVIIKRITTTPYYIESKKTMIVASLSAGTTASVWLPLATPAREMKFAVLSASMVILASGSDTIEGNASIGLYAQYQTAHLHNDGVSTWYIM